MNLLEERVSRVQRVLETIEEHRLLSTPEYLTILRGPLDQPLQGFRTDPPRLTCLHELLDENWLGERILDARTALLSDELNRRTPNLIRILNCAFLMDLSNSFRERRPSRMLLRVREELLVDQPMLIAFIINKNGNHWAPTVTSLTLRLVMQGDSYGYPDEPQLLEMVRWWLQDVVPQDGEWTESNLNVPQQASDSGSCGLAAVSAVANLARIQENTWNGLSDASSSRSWTNTTSFEVRCEWMQLILRRHLLTLESLPVRAIVSYIQIRVLIFCISDSRAERCRFGRGTVRCRDLCSTPVSESRSHSLTSFSFPDRVVVGKSKCTSFQPTQYSCNPLQPDRADIGERITQERQGRTARPYPTTSGNGL